MLLTQSSINRLGIFFYDSDGVVDDYVPTLLAGFKPHFSEMTIVCNGKLNEAGQSILSGIPTTSSFVPIQVSMFGHIKPPLIPMDGKNLSNSTRSFFLMQRLWDPSIRSPRCSKQ